MTHMLKHTPGPWECDLDYIVAPDPDGRHPDIYIAEIAAEDSEGRIASVEQQIANRQLITAAPNLLAACRMVVDRWERGDLAEAARACGAAIAEATTTSSPPPAAAIDLATKPYSVLLLYPDWTNDDSTETYYAWVDAPDSLAAVAEAQRQALAANEWTDRDPADFAPLLVTEGHHYGHPMSSD
jgi:hypothetical protein